MSQLIQLIIATIATMLLFIAMVVSFRMGTKISGFPHISNNRKIRMIGIFVVALITFEATSIISIYHLPQNSYVFVALFIIVAISTILLVERRVYKRDHPNELTEVKRTTFREAFRAANGKTDRVSLILGIAFFLALIASQVFHQESILSFATPLVIGPWMIYGGTKMLRQAQEEQQPDGIHWYTQYKILFGTAAVLLLPYDFVVRGPLTFVQTYPYANSVEDVFACLALIPLLASGFFFFRRQYLQRHNRVSSNES